MPMHSLDNQSQPSIPDPSQMWGFQVCGHQLALLKCGSHSDLLILEFASFILILWGGVAMICIKILHQHCLKQKAAINHEIK